MSYVNPGWVNNAEPAIDADNLNNLSSTLEQVPVANGGTGRQSLDSGSILTGNGTEAVGTLSGTGALHAQAAGSPVFGTLPINCGGTGATTLEGLRANIGLTNAGWVAQDTEPSVRTVLWIDTGNKNIIKFYNGSAWVACAGTFG